MQIKGGISHFEYRLPPRSGVLYKETWLRLNAGKVGQPL
jgi:hypothetical protein